MEFYSHIRQSIAGDCRTQTVRAHCRGTARYAREALGGIGLGEAACFAGLLHDMGKMKQEFQAYLLEGKGSRGSVNHTFAGCRFILNHFHGEKAERYEDLTAELLAYAAGAHHGLFDCMDPDGRSGFLHRMEKEEIGYEESRENYLRQCADLDELTARFQEADRELLPVYEKISTLAGDDDGEFAFYQGMLARLLLSAVIEGDRRDTAEFMTERYRQPEPESYGTFWEGLLLHVEETLRQLPNETPIQQARAELSQRCRDRAEKCGGIIRLNLPTGAGKTLSSLRFALAHAQKWKKHRLIFTSPLLSILDQNAAVIRSFLGDDRIVLEHHSNVIEPETAMELDLRELAVESWSSPVIVTTLVQLLNTLFDGKTTSVRRFQSLCASVIVIDEVQTVPTKMLSLFDLAVNFLAEVCGATVVLCSATQPTLECAEHPIRPVPDELVPYEERLWAPFRRTRILDSGTMTLEQAADFARSVLCETNSLLIVCNKKREAAELLRMLNGAAEVCEHLSAAMCQAHRKQTLARLYQALEEDKTCLCVATQVIEAGVDISFQAVIRITAGMDNIVQAAGRCNRNAAQLLAPVYTITLLDENLSRLEEIRRSRDATLSLLAAYQRQPEQFGNDLSSDFAIAYYYRRLYGAMPREAQDYLLERERVTLFSLLSGNGTSWKPASPAFGCFFLNQAFQTAGKRFTVFDSDTRDVVVPFGDGAALIGELAAQHPPDAEFLARWAARAKPYTVAVYRNQLRMLEDVLAEYGGVLTVPPEYYDAQVGLTVKPGTFDFLEV